MSSRPKTPLILAQALTAVGLPEQGRAKFTVALLRALDARGLILLPHAAGPLMLDAAVRAMHATGYILGNPAERKLIKQALRYRAMVEAERRRLGLVKGGAA